MVKDRLSEFQVLCMKNGVVSMRALEADCRDTIDCDNPSTSESGELLAEDEWAEVDQFLSRVNDVNQNIEHLESLVLKLKKIHGEVLQSPGAEPSLIQSLNDVNDQFTAFSKKTNTALKLITQDADQVTNPNDAQVRIKKNQAFTLKKRLATVLTEFNAEQVQYREKCKDKMRIYLKCVDHEMADNEIDDAIESGKLYNTKSLMLGDRDKQLLLLKDVESRHQDIIKLEKSIAELHEMFQDIAMLIEAQGEILDNIEMNVATTADYVQKAHQNVTQAKNMKHKNIKMKIAVCICAIIMIFLLLTLGAGAFCFYLPFICR